MKLLVGCWTWSEASRVSLYLAMCPHPVLRHPSAGILLLLVPVDLHIAGDGLDTLQKLRPELVLVTGITQLVGANLVNQSVRPVPPHQNVFGRRQGFLWPITIVDQSR